MIKDPEPVILRISGTGQGSPLMPKYELMYLLGSHVAETEVPNLSAQVLKSIEDFGGAEVQETQLGKKKLAYPIKKTRNGYYVVVDFNMDSGKINQLDAKVRSLDSSIIRYILVNLDEHLERTAKDKALAAKMPARRIPTARAEDRTRAEAIKPAIKLEDIDEKLLDEKIEQALSEDLTK